MFATPLGAYWQLICIVSSFITGTRFEHGLDEFGFAKGFETVRPHTSVRGFYGVRLYVPVPHSSVINPWGDLFFLYPGISPLSLQACTYSLSSLVCLFNTPQRSRRWSVNVERKIFEDSSPGSFSTQFGQYLSLILYIFCPLDYDTMPNYS